MAYTEAQKRRMRYNAGLKTALTPRESSAMAFPELAPENANMMAASVPETTSIPVAELSNKLVNQEISLDDLAARHAESQGITKAEAYPFLQEVFQGLPDTVDPIDYNRLDLALTTSRRDIVGGAIEGAQNAAQTMKDIEFVGTSLGAALGSSQQALFGVAAGESMADATARVWPMADIRDEDGVEERKAVIPMAIRGVMLGAVGELLDFVGQPGNEFAGTVLKGEARRVAEELAATDYRDNLLTGSELIEYWMHGDGLLGTSLPAQGTPERAAYDTEVRDNAAQNYLATSEGEGSGGLARIALGGALLDVVADPLLFISEAPVAMTRGLRLLAPVSSKARVTGAIAGKTRRVRDLASAVADAEKWVDDASIALRAKPSKVNKARAAAASHNLAKQVARSAVASSPGEAILLRTLPRIRPEHIKPVGNVYLGATEKTRSAITKSFLTDKTNEAFALANRLERQSKLAAQEGAQLPLLGAEAGGMSAKEAKEAAEGWRETAQWFSRRMEAEKGNRTDSFFKQSISEQVPYEPTTLSLIPEGGTGSPKLQALTTIQKNIWRGVAQGAPQSEILQWERAYTKVAEGLDLPPNKVIRPEISSEAIVADALVDLRKNAVLEEVEPLRDYRHTDSVAQAEQRIAYGPDATERSAEAAKVLAAGGEIDDVMFHGTSVEMYNSSYGQQMRPHSGTEMRSAKASSELELAGNVEWLGKDPVNTTVEAASWQQSLGERLGDRWSKALHPRSWNMRPAGAFQNIREPMRVLQSVSPRTYTRIHNAVRAQEFELTRMNELFSRELKMLGVYRDVEGATVTNLPASERFYRIMNLDPTTDDFTKAMAVLSETERRSVRRIRTELDFVADKLGLRDTDRYIEGYIDHVFDERWFQGGSRPPVFDGMDVSAKVFNPYMMERTGAAGYVEDLGLALDYYTRSASQKLHMEPLFLDLEEIGKSHLLRNPGDTWFADYLDDVTANFKGKPSTLGQWADRQVGALNARMRARASVTGAAQSVGRGLEKAGAGLGQAGEFVAGLPGPGGIKRLGGSLASDGVRMNQFGSEMAVNGMPLYRNGDVSRAVLGATALSYASVLGGSGRYFPMAVSTAIATNVSRYGLFDAAKGMLVMGTPRGRALAKTAGLERQWGRILEDAAWTKLGSLAGKMPSFNGVTVAGPSIAATENLIRGWSMHAAMSDLIRKRGMRSWKEAGEAGLANSFLHETVRATEESMHLFGQLGKPPVFNRASKSGSAAATQFLSFMPKQSEELLAQTLQNPGKIGQYMMVSGYLQRVAAKIGLDISDYVGMGFMPKSSNDLQSITWETVSSFYGMNAEFGLLLTGNGDQGRAQRAGEQFLRNAQNFIPLAMASHRTGQALETLRIGKVFREGKLVREADLGGFKWDHSKSYLENYLALPQGLLSATGDPSSPTDIASILSSLNSPAGVLERQQFMGMRSSLARRQAQRANITSRLREAQLTGNGEGFTEALQEAIEAGMLPPDVTKMVERTGMEIAVPRLMRMQLDSNQQLLDGIETMHREFMLHQMRFGQ